MNEESVALRRQIRAAWQPLGAVAGAQIHVAAPTLAALSVDRTTRNRLVIFDPASVQLLQPLIRPSDLRPWHTTAAADWVIAISRTAAAEAEQFRALMQHLATLEPPVPEQPQQRGRRLYHRRKRLGAQLRRLPSRSGQAAKAGFVPIARSLTRRAGDVDEALPPTPPETNVPWWALDPALVVPPAAPRIIVAADPLVVAWDEGAALISGPAQSIARAEPYWLALLASPQGRQLLAADGDLAVFPIPVAPEPVQAGLAGLALSAATLAAQRYTLEQAVVRRLLADFGPPGVKPGPHLQRWWELDFADLHAAVQRELRNDIPERFRATWAQIHADEQATHQRASAYLAEIEASIAGQVQGLYWPEHSR